MDPLGEFMRLVRENMEARGFCQVGTDLPANQDAACLMFAGSPASWESPFVAVPVSITGLKLLQNNTTEAMAALVRERCAAAASAYMDRVLIHRPDNG